MQSVLDDQESGAIRNLFKVHRDSIGNLPSMPGIFPDYPAPIVRNTYGGRELALARWGMPIRMPVLDTESRICCLSASGTGLASFRL